MHRLAFWLLRPLARYHTYSVSAPGGYVGYYTFGGRVLAWVDTDGMYYFRW